MTETSTRKAVHLVLVASAGLKPNAWSHDIMRTVSLEDLFAP